MQIKCDKRFLDMFDLCDAGMDVDPYVVRSRNQYFVAVALDLILGIVVTDAKEEW